MTTKTRRPLRPALAACLAAALALAVPGAASAAAPSPSPSPSAPAVKDTGVRQWGVRPSTPDGKRDGRTHFTLQSTPGGSVTDYALIANLSPAAVTFTVYGTDAFNTESGQFDLLPAAQKPHDLGLWMHFGSNTVTVPAKGEVVVPFTIQVPQGASPGDHAAGVVVSLTEPAGPGSQQVTIDTRVAARVYLRLPGNLRPRLLVSPVSVKYRGVVNPFGSGSTSVSYTVSNPGNIRLTSHATIAITGPFGIGLGTVKRDLPELLPGQHASFSTVVPGVFPLGPLTAKVTLAPFPDPEQPVGQAIHPVSGNAYTWAVPWLLLLLILLAIAGGAIWWWLRRRQTLHRLDNAVTSARADALNELQTTPATGRHAVGAGQGSNP